MIITSGIDGFFRIWKTDGQLICNLNIKHPLPIKWDLS